MKGLYQIRIGDELKTYHNIDDIPEEFDNLIKFAPQIPKEPHTEEEHEIIESLNQIFKNILSRERR